MAVVGGGGEVVASAAPGNAPALWAVTDVHYGVRELERALRVDLLGVERHRGASRAHTLAAIDAIGALAELVDRHEHREPGDKTPCQCGHCVIMRKLAGWTRGIEMLPAVDDAVRWSVIRAPCPDCSGREKACTTCRGRQLRILCPYCDTPSLRAAVPWGLVACGNPDCRDSEGNPPVAKMATSALAHGRGFLLWNDGRVT